MYTSKKENMAADTIIRNGHVIDPANDINQVCDVAIKGDIIIDVGNDIISGADTRIYDASGCIVTPGLIDAHVHVYEHCTPLGMNADRYCLGRGTTTVVDAGSAGSGTFAGFQKFIIEKSKTRIYAFLHIAAHGMAAADYGIGGECDSLNQVNTDLCLSCIQNNPEIIIGVKVRLQADCCDEGKNEQEAYRRALAVCEMAGVPLMTHHTFSSIPKNATEGSLGCPASLRPGDFHTHTLHGYPSTIIDPEAKSVFKSVMSSRERGVLFDVGHGLCSFTWTVAEICVRQGFFPDMITTDLHSGNVDGPVYDLPTTMSKMLHLGMPLYDIIKSVTINPARALRREQVIGSLGVGRKADVTVLSLKDCDLDLEDSQGQLRKVQKLLIPMAVWKDGVEYPIVPLEKFPNMEKLGDLRKSWDQLVIRDEHV